MKREYHAVDVAKYISAILVIVIHTSPFLPYANEVNYFFMNMVARGAVPFFLLTSGYFIAMNRSTRKGYVKAYVHSLVKLYLLWSIIYIPFGLEWIQQNLDLPYILYPLALVFGLLYLGTYYHLWYIPALIFAIVITYWLKKYMKTRTIVGIAFLLFCFSMIETYYEYLGNGWLKDIFDGYLAIFFTTRNGLLFAWVFLSLGIYAWEQPWFTKKQYHVKGFIISIIILIIEGVLTYEKSLDHNSMIALLPLTLYLFLILQDVSLNLNLPYGTLRSYSSLYYFSHAIPLVIVPKILNEIGYGDLWQHGMVRFISVLCLTHIISKCILLLNSRKKTLKEKA